jgi:predicted metal-dependent hydrolase
MIREPRRSVTITVYPDLRVIVRVPAARRLDAVVEHVLRKRAWIARHLARFEAMPDARPRYQSGESHLYLGETYPLHVERSARRGVAQESGRLLVRIRPASGPRAVRLALRRWYARQARTEFEARLARLQREVPLFARLAWELRIRRMTRRWGSCTSRRVITMNPLLIQASPACVDYVLAHELVHLLEPGHTPRFYGLLVSVFPDWKEREAALKHTAIIAT